MFARGPFPARSSSPRALRPRALPPGTGPATFVAGPNHVAVATPTRARKRTRYRVWRPGGRLMAIRDDGAAYGHVRSGSGNPDSAKRRTVDGGTTRHTDVDTRVRARPRGSQSGPEALPGRLLACLLRPLTPAGHRQDGTQNQREQAGQTQRDRLSTAEGQGRHWSTPDDSCHDWGHDRG